MPLRGMRRTSPKNPQILSHEFVIQNHADIVSCTAMFFVLGLVFQATSPLAQLFVTLGHNVTKNSTDESESEKVTLYGNGVKDICAVFFYMLVAIVMHAVLQEYVLDKINRRMHLSKLKHSKFNESGQLIVFYLVSIVWGVDIMLSEHLVWDLSNLWVGYPTEHVSMPFVSKFFFIIQIAYWLHCFPELYFQKVKKDELSSRVQYAAFYLIFTVVGYALNFSRITLCLLLSQYLVEAFRHVGRLLYFAEQPTVAKFVFYGYNTLFVIARFLSFTLAILTFWYGLPLSPSAGTLNTAEGNYNIQIIRINCLTAICLMQAKLMWTFITFHLRRRREYSVEFSSKKKTGLRSANVSLKNLKKKEYDDLPEADQQQIKNKKSK